MGVVANAAPCRRLGPLAPIVGFMQALIAGSTGLVGSALLELLVQSANVERVTALVRRSSHAAHPKLDERVVSFDALAPALAGVRATHAFCCLGTTMAQAGSKAAFKKVDHDYVLEFARGARAAGASGFLLVSALGANEGSLLFYNRVKGETERDLKELGFPTLHLARPSLLLGERKEKRVREGVGSVVGQSLAGALVGPLRKYRPISAVTVARALLRLGLEEKPGVFVHDSDELARIGDAA
jgi:uncharacterized protein YbjT (DUF2867 family)